jgi:hypothetical protein
MMPPQIASWPLSLDHLAPADRLVAINELLEAQGLAPLKGVGDNAQGWSEVVGISGWYEHPSGLWHDLSFIVRRVGGKQYSHTVRFNTNSKDARGVILIPVIDDQVVIIKQFRIALGCETWELARGFAERLEGDGVPELLALPAALVRELGEEVMQDATIISVQPIGSIFENTGTHNCLLDVSMVAIAPPVSTSTPALGGSQRFAARLVSWRELSSPTDLGIRDAHSLAAIALVREQRERSAN